MRVARPVSCLMIAGSLTGVLAGCASTGNTTPAPGDPPVDRVVAVDQNGHSVHTTDSYTGTEAQVHAPQGSAIAALSQIYPDLGIPIGTLVSSAGQIGNTSYRVPGHRLKTMQLSRLLECGQESVTGARADIDEVTIDVLSTVKPAGDTASVVTTFVSATARPLGTSSDPVVCSSNGALERMINDRLAKALGSSAQ